MSHTLSSSDFVFFCVIVGLVAFLFGLIVGAYDSSDNDEQIIRNQNEFKRIFGFEVSSYSRNDHYVVMKEKLLLLRNSSEFFELNRGIEAAVHCGLSEVVTEVLGGVNNPEARELPTL